MKPNIFRDILVSTWFLQISTTVRGVMRINNDLHGHIEDSGAVRIVDAGISVVSEKEMFPGKSCKERVLYITASKVEKLLISALLVVYVK